MEKVELKAKAREDTGKKVNSLRRQGQIPAVLYGHKVKNQNLQVDTLQFNKIYQQAGGSTLLDLFIDEKKPIKVLIQDVQEDSVSGEILHVDFHQVRMDEEITAEIELNFIGEAPAEKEQGGILVKNFDKIKVECLPQYLIHQVDVDVSPLDNFDKDIKIKDLPIPKEVQVVGSVDEVVVHVLPPKSEEELEKELAEETGEEVKEVEVEEKGKQEEGESEAGEKEGDKKEENKETPDQGEKEKK